MRWAEAGEVGSWNGTYTFDGAAGQSAGGSPVTYHYTLSLRSPTCSLKLEGYQEDESIRCGVAGSRESIDVAFTSYANGSTVNVYGVAVYPPDKPLFRLTWNKDAGRNELHTTWLALHPDGIPDEGVFFRQMHR
jgi:hypothetical protein